MLTRLKSAWHDPVWSKVIAAVIIAMVAGLWGAWKWPDLGPSFRAALGWLAVDAKVSRGLLLLIVLGFFVASAGMYMWAAGHWLNRVRERAVQDYKRTLTRDQPLPTPVLPALDIDVDNLTAAALHVLLDAYPQDIDLADIWHTLCRIDWQRSEYIAGKAAVSRGLEQLVGSGVIATHHQGVTIKRYRLTEPGMNWMLKRLTFTGGRRRAKPSAE